MAFSPKDKKGTLDARFKFAEDSFPGGMGGWDSQLRSAIGFADGERYLLRLFKKTRTPLDDDLRSLVARSLRKVRRVLSSRTARDVLVEILEVVEDDAEIAIVMLDPGSPISGASQRTRARQSRYLLNTERRIFWRNLARVAEGLALCHDAGIVHGAVSAHTIFSHSDDHEDYRLGGYEACVHIGDVDLGGSGHLLRAPGAISFRQDWIDLGGTAETILGTRSHNGPALLSIERRMLDRLASPPQFQLFDGQVVLREMSEVIEEIDRVGSSTEGELVLYPSRNVLQSDLPSLTSDAVDAHDTEAVLRFLEENLKNPGIRVATGSRDIVRIVTDLALYTVKVVDERIGMIVAAKKRRPDDWSVYEATDLMHRLHLSRNRKSSDDRVRKLGPGVKRWMDMEGSRELVGRQHDSASWHALLLLEAFTLLREQFRIYPIEVVMPSVDDNRSMIWIVPRTEVERDERRVVMGLRPTTEALKRELGNDDGRTDWTLSQVNTLAGERGRLPQLNYEGSGVVGGRRAYAFTTSETTGLVDSRYLRPRRDAGFERAVRRRLQNIVAVRTNVELLRALDDPAQVAFDEALRDIAAPGPAPAGMDPSKTAAWNSIAQGKSINVIVGPPGVGKTYLISHLIKGILSLTPDARILVSAQNHDTLAHMEEELKKELRPDSTIIVRVERSRSSEVDSALRESAATLLRSVADAETAGITVNQRREIRKALDPQDGAEKAISDRVFRDTESLLLRSSDVTLATTSSHAIEEMIADGEQFDWVIIEEAARANGAELIGALLLGNRRVMIGDHNQLSPFDVVERQKFYDGARAAELLRDAQQQLGTISDLPPEVDTALEILRSDASLLQDVLAVAARLEEPFRSIAEREAEREKDRQRPSTIVNTLLEQSRMHPAICELVSNTFYKGELVSSERVKRRKQAVKPADGFSPAPVVVLNLPSLSVVKKEAFETPVKRSYRNESEATALLAALRHLRPNVALDGAAPTLAILSPYQGQVGQLERLLKQQVDSKNGTLFGFASPRGNGKFIFTSDSFQGSEADLVLASLVRNNVLVGSRALGFVRNPQRMNVLLSRARQKLVLATSLQFITETVDGVDPDRLGGEMGFLRTMIDELNRLSETQVDAAGMGVAIVNVDERGGLRP